MLHQFGGSVKRYEHQPRKNILADPFIREQMKDRIEMEMKCAQSFPPSKGRDALLDMLDGKALSRTRAILAYCCRCQYGYKDGKKDCENKTCPHYTYMPYGKMSTKYVRPDRRK